MSAVHIYKIIGIKIVIHSLFVAPVYTFYLLIFFVSLSFMVSLPAYLHINPAFVYDVHSPIELLTINASIHTPVYRTFAVMDTHNLHTCACV